MPLGEAYGIMAVCLFGPELPTEKHRHADRLEVWKNAARHTLNKDSIKAVLEWPDHKALVKYIQGLLTTTLVCIQMDMPNSAASILQTVFSGIKAPETQLHLGLDPTESVMEQ